MVVNSKFNQLELLCIIVDYGKARRVIKIAKKSGIRGASVFLGKGTIRNNPMLKFFDLAESRKEIIIMITDNETRKFAMEAINDKLKFYKSNRGIAFAMSVSQVIGLSQYHQEKISEGVGETMYKAIFTIVDRGKAEDVIDAAVSAGSKGGTIINARGSGIHETSKIFNMEIEPEKEIVLILSENELTDKITSAIREKTKIDQPGQGIIFVQDVQDAYGLNE